MLRVVPAASPCVGVYMSSTGRSRVEAALSLVDEIASALVSFEDSIARGVLEEKLDKLIAELEALATSLSQPLEASRVMYTVERVKLLKTYATALRKRLASGSRRGFTRARDDMAREVASIKSYLLFLRDNME